MYYASGVSLSFSFKSLTTKLLDVHPLINEAAAFASVAKLNNNFEKALVLANESDNSFDLTKPLPSAVFSPYAFKIISLMI